MNKNATLSEVREAVAFVTEIQESVQQMHFQLHQVEEKQTNERELLKTSIIDFIMVIKTQFRS